jgi:hypothetical protein
VGPSETRAFETPCLVVLPLSSNASGFVSVCAAPQWRAEVSSRALREGIEN